jgi:hypothetical protein
MVRLFILITVIYSCNHIDTRRDKQTRSHHIILASDTTGNPTLTGLVKTIENSDCFYSKGVGIDGRSNETYKAYSDLLKQTSNEFWYKMSYSRSAVLKVYAYKTLFDRNDSTVTAIQNRLRHDSVIFCLSSNDLFYRTTVSFYVNSITRVNR